MAALTFGLGAPPWIALLLGVTFGGYGLLKNQLGLGPVISVFFETGLLAPLALLWLVGLHSGAWGDPSGRPGAFFGGDLRTTVLLALSGPLMTGGPLILFSYAARRIRLATLGLVQYLNPTLQFAVAVAAFGEAFTAWHAVAFPMIWVALALYSVATWRQDRAGAQPGDERRDGVVALEVAEERGVGEALRHDVLEQARERVASSRRRRAGRPASRAARAGARSAPRTVRRACRARPAAPRSRRRS